MSKIIVIKERWNGHTVLPDGTPRRVVEYDDLDTAMFENPGDDIMTAEAAMRQHEETKRLYSIPKQQPQPRKWWKFWSS